MYSDTDLEALEKAGFTPIPHPPGWLVHPVADYVACIRPGTFTTKELVVLDTQQARGWSITSAAFNGVACCLQDFQDIAQAAGISGWDFLQSEQTLAADDAAFSAVAVLRGLGRAPK